jgi:hypothetical protein
MATATRTKITTRRAATKTTARSRGGAKKTTTNTIGNGTRARRARRPVAPMTADVKSAAMKAMATFEQELGETADFTGSSTRQSKTGALMKSVKLDNGHRAVLTIRYR